MILNGKEISEKIIEDLKIEVENLKKLKIFPCLAVIMVGNDNASIKYIKYKKIACEKVGIKSKEFILPFETSEEKLIEIIEKLNNDKNISGILVQLPLPKHINQKNIFDKINSKKDVDAFNTLNKGKLLSNTADFAPCTPLGIIEIFKNKKINLCSKHCIIIGRSDIVGKPLALLLLQNNATVTICHSKTKNLNQICKSADIIVSAVGKPKFLNSKMISKGSIVIDVGTNRDENRRLCGDADFEDIYPLCSYITPVPNGVGPMTVAMLVKNTILAAKIQNNNL